MRIGYEFFLPSYEEEANALSLWDMCPHAKAGLVYSRAALEVRSDELEGRGVEVRKARELLGRAERLTRGIVLLVHLNLSMYFEPRALSFAPFFHLSRLVHALRTRPELLPPGEAIDDEVLGAMGLGDQLRALDEYLDSEDVPPRPDFEERLQLPRGQRLRCNLATTALLFAQADLRRLRLGVQWEGLEGEGVRRLIRSADVCLRRTMRDSSALGLISFVAASSVPLFEVMDRLDSGVVMPLVLDHPQWADREFLMHVLPTHNIEASHVRGMLGLHCDAAFKDLLQERRGGARGRREPFLVVEVGAHLGGCSFYALTHLDARVRVLAVEPYGPAAAAMRRTAADNEHLDGRFQVVESFISDDPPAGRHGAPVYALGRRSAVIAPWLHQPDWEPSTSDTERGGAALRGARLDAVLREQGVMAVDVLRIHVLGRELSVLRSAEALFRAGLVRAVAVAIFGPTPNGEIPSHDRQDAIEIGRFLHRHGLELRYAGRTGAAAEALLGGGPGRPDGTSTLVGVRGGS